MFAKILGRSFWKYAGFALISTLILLSVNALLALEQNNLPGLVETFTPQRGETGPSFSKSFTPNTIGPGSTSTLQYDININGLVFLRRL